MAEPYPIELRKRVVESYECGEGSYPEVAVLFSLGEATVKRWVLLKRTQGDVVPSKKGGGTPSTICENEIERLVAQLRDPTAAELTAAYNCCHAAKQRVHVSSMKRALHRFGYVVKKNADGHWRLSGRMSSPSV